MSEQSGLGWTVEEVLPAHVAHPWPSAQWRVSGYRMARGNYTSDHLEVAKDRRPGWGDTVAIRRNDHVIYLTIEQARALARALIAAADWDPEDELRRHAVQLATQDGADT